MKVNFIYTYSVDMEREQEGFFIVTPPEVSSVLLQSIKFSSFFCYRTVLRCCPVYVSYITGARDVWHLLH